MSDTRKNLVPSYWPSPVGVSSEFPPTPAWPVDELWRASWPATIAQAWAPPTPQISASAPPGGLLASLTKRSSGGLFGQLAPPVERGGSEKSWWVAPPHPSTLPTPGDYLSPLRRVSTEDVERVPASAAAARVFPEPSRFLLGSVSTGNPNGELSPNDSGQFQ